MKNVRNIDLDSSNWVSRFGSGVAAPGENIQLVDSSGRRTLPHRDIDGNPSPEANSRQWERASLKDLGLHAQQTRGEQEPAQSSLAQRQISLKGKGNLPVIFHLDDQVAYPF